MDGSIAYLTDTIKVALVTDAYTPSLSSHQYLDDIGGNTIGTAQTLASKTSTAGVADADDITFSAVTAGSTVNYLLIYKDTGSSATSPLIALIDTGTGLPFDTSGGDVSVVWSSGSSKIFKL